MTDSMQYPFHIIAPLVGAFLSSDDCCALTLAHSSFERAHMALQSQIWRLRDWLPPPSPSLGGLSLLLDPTFWSTKWRALEKRMPGIKTLEIQVYSHVLSEESVRCMWRALPSSLAQCVVVLTAADDTLLPFVLAQESWPSPDSESGLPLRLLFILKFTEPSSVQGLTSGMLHRFMDALSHLGKRTKRDVSVYCKIETDAIAKGVWDVVAAAVPSGLVDRIRYIQGSRLVRVTEATFSSLAQARSFDMTQHHHLVDPDDPPNTIVECARTLFDKTVNVCSINTIRKFQFIAQRCKRLEALVLTHMSSDVAFVNGGITLQKCMEALDASSVMRFRLSRHALLTPSVVTLLRQMVLLKRRADLTVGIVVAPDDEGIYLVCGELVRRYLLCSNNTTAAGPFPVIEIEHFDAHRNRTKPHAMLLAEMQMLSPCIHDAWSMMAPPQNR
jgi:hypothetical protein